MSDDVPAIAWREIHRDARLYLGLDDGDAVPRDELVEQAKANGWSEREVRESLRATDALKAADGDLETLALVDETPRVPSESDEAYLPAGDDRPLDEYEPKGYVLDDTDDDRAKARDAAVTLTASRWGPLFDTGVDEAGMWWEDAYDCACRAVEAAVVDALAGGAVGEGDDDPDVSGVTGEKKAEDGEISCSTPTPDTTESDEERPRSVATRETATPSGETVYPTEVVERDVWVSWILDGEERKRPVAPWETGHAYPVKWRGDLPEEERPETSFDEAHRWVDFSLDHLGLSLPDDARSDELRLGIIIPVDRPPREERITLIDWDDVRDPETEEIHPTAAEYIDKFGGYVEVSRSGEGLHQFVFGGLPGRRNKLIAPIDDEPFIGDDLPAVEVYDGGRHVAMTGEHVQGTSRDLVDGQDCIHSLVDEFGAAEIEAGYRSGDADEEQKRDPSEDSNGFGEEVDAEIGDAPDDLPECYARALEARLEPSSTNYGTNHDLNLHVAILGVYAGYEVDTLVDHFREFPLFGDSDKFDAEITRQALKGTKLKAEDENLAPPSERTLCEKGILDGGCSCPVHTDEEAIDDPRDLLDDPVVVEPRDAWRAAAAVRPGDLDPDTEGGEYALSLDVSDDREAWVADDGRRVDGIVRAVALEEGLIADPDADLDTDAFDEAYRLARWRYDAPLPEYVDETTATEQKWVLRGALWQIEHWHLDSIRSTVVDTGDDPEVVAEINPCWEYSSSGRRVIAFRSGAFYCREHECSIYPLEFVALEEGIIDSCGEDLGDEEYFEAVEALRDRGAPVPEWHGEENDFAAWLPDPDDLLEEFATDGERLQQAREEVETLVEEAAADATTADLVNVLPALGKTTSTVKNAGNRPTLYAAPRKELQQEVVDKAEKYGVSAYILPVLAENHIKRDAKAAGAAAVREAGQQLLRDRDELRERLPEDIHPDPDEEADADEVNLDRATCPTANGAHGEEWQIAVQVASELGFSPQYMHRHGSALFGEDLPCTCEEDGHDGRKCPYGRAWERVADPDRPVDLLVGSRTHAHVTSARTWYGHDGDRVDVEPRTITIDEYPDDVYGEGFGEEAPAIATWLATALREDLDAARDTVEADLWDTWVRDWLHGASEPLPELAHLDDHLAIARGVLDARDAIAEIRPADRPDAAEALRAAVDDGLGCDADPQEVRDLAGAALAGVREAELPDELAREASIALDDVREAAASLDVSVGEPDLVADGDTLGATFREVVECALSGALDHGEDHAIGAARDALRGGQDGTAALAVYADDPYAHPKAYLLLAGMVSDGAVVETSAFKFDNTRPKNRLTRTRVDGATVLFDRDHKGAYVLDPPEFTAADGCDCPVVGLDATGRETLWSLAIGQGVETRDIHDTAEERRAFLRDVLNLQVVQTSPHINSYSSPANKNFDGDVSLVRSIAEEYGSGRDGRLRSNTLSTTTDPGVITTKKARKRIDDRLTDHTAAIDHYGNVVGSNDLAGCNLGAVLGTRHFGDRAVEKWAALAGEEMTRTGRGAGLEYDSEVANAYLRHMQHDQTMQAILRFGRDEEGALVFSHTAALRDDLPVVADGAVVSAHSKAGVEVRDAVAPHIRRASSFTVSDIVDEVEAGRRTVQRKLSEFVDLGYLEREDPGDGLANRFTAEADPGVGDTELPDLPTPGGADPGEEHLEQYNTGIVGVRAGDYTPREPRTATHTQLPAPDTAGEAEDGPPTPS